MAQKRMLELYDTFKDSVKEGKRMKLAQDILNSDVEVIREMSIFLQHQMSMRVGERMRMKPVVLDAFVRHYPTMERFSRYQRGNDLIFCKSIGAFAAYKIMSVLSSHVRSRLFNRLKGSNLAAFNSCETGFLNFLKISLEGRVLFSCPFLKFIDFFIHFNFPIKNACIECSCVRLSSVEIPEKVVCLSDISNSDVFPMCGIFNFLNNVEKVAARSRCLKGVVCPLEAKKIILLDERDPIVLKVEDDVLKLENDTEDRSIFDFLSKNIKLKGSPKKLELNITTKNSLYPPDGYVKLLKKAFKTIREVDLVFCIKAHKAQALLVALCKEAKSLAVRGVKVNFRIRLCRSGQAVDPGIAKKHVIFAGRVFHPTLAGIGDGHNCGHAFDWTERNLVVHVCAGYSLKCELERKDGRKDEVPEIVNPPPPEYYYGLFYDPEPYDDYLDYHSWLYDLYARGR
ncbi:unnamed protein product [Bursaphelenchus xylophilus]|uniref:(pine wood nematode) hypothetical protein n=1 Tax=Bursaphelenchus xylophilus TaxID=6326 RepID=A0A1I7SKY2_BURXY|nr:unnamed protein product [Bursaphelenchus xylophilus]CAG9129297.1 unnamed protein product [Bursaphelenchus xylophilus]